MIPNTLASLQDPLIDETTGWLREEALARGLGKEFESIFVRRDGEWYHFSVKMDAANMPVFQRAELLRELEDAWDEQHPGSRLLVIPSAG